MPNTADYEQNWKSQIGIKTISDLSYSTRTVLEVRKYIKDVIVDDSNNNLDMAIMARSDFGAQEHFGSGLNAYSQAYMYLTPSAIKSTNTTVDILEGASPDPHSAPALGKIAKLSALTLIEQLKCGAYSSKINVNPRNKNIIVKSTDGLDSTLGIMEKYNCRVITKDEKDYLNYDLMTKSIRNPDPGPSGNDLFITGASGHLEPNPEYYEANINSSTGAKYDFRQDLEAAETARLEKLAAMVAYNDKTDFSFSSNIFNLDEENNTLRVTLRGNNEYVNTLPLPLLSLLGEGTKSNNKWSQAVKTKGIEAAIDNYYVWMIYKNIVSVQYMAGFAGDEQYITSGDAYDNNAKKLITSHASSPQWLALTPAAIESMKSSGATSMLCRLERYYNKDFKVSESPLTSEIPILNKYFVLNIGEFSAVNIGSFGPALIAGVAAAAGMGTGTY